VLGVGRSCRTLRAIQIGTPASDNGPRPLFCSQGLILSAISLTSTPMLCPGRVPRRVNRRRHLTLSATWKRHSKHMPDRSSRAAIIAPPLDWSRRPSTTHRITVQNSSQPSWTWKPLTGIHPDHDRIILNPLIFGRTSRSPPAPS
jgi:hypothetical protein